MNIDNNEPEEYQEELFENEEEIGTEDEEDIQQEFDQFSQAVIWGTDWTSETVNSQLIRGNIDLFPKFQRRDAWSNRDKSRFIESIILGLPIPQIILAEKTNARGKYIVIDGKQRLLTIRRFFSLGGDFKPLKLTGLEVLTELNGKTYKKLSEDAAYSDFVNQLENQSIRTVVIKNWRNESFLYTVFLRLNTGSKKLSPQELRQALHPGQFIDFADEFSVNSQQIKTMLNLKTPDYRMRDVEIVIRYFSYKYFIENYDGNLKKFFDQTVQNLNQRWEAESQEISDSANQLNSAIDFTIELFGTSKIAFSKWNGDSFQGNFNRAIFDIMVFYFSIPEVREEIIQNNRQENVVESFQNLCVDDPDFLTSFEHTTKSMGNTDKRFSTWGNTLADLLDTLIPVPSVVNGSFEINMV